MVQIVAVEILGGRSGSALVFYTYICIYTRTYIPWATSIERQTEATVRGQSESQIQRQRHRHRDREVLQLCEVCK